MLADSVTRMTLKHESQQWPSVDLDQRQAAELDLWLMGAFAPLAGYVTEAEAEIIRSAQRLPGGMNCPLAWRLEVHEKQARDLYPGQWVALRDPEGLLLAALQLQENLPAKIGLTRYLAGPLRGLERPPHYSFKHLRHTPMEIRKLARDRNWQKIVIVPPDVLLTAAEVAFLDDWAIEAGGGVLFCAVLEGLEAMDIARVRAVDAIVFRMGRMKSVMTLVGVDLSWEAFLLLAHNFGATHLFSRQAFTREEVHVLAEMGMEPVIPPAELLELVQNGLFPEVELELRLANPPPDRHGLVVFFTGLSGSGKSSLARALQARLMEIGPRQVTLLDGDLVRKHLSSELTFSREHRELNVRRIGFVAAEVAKHCGIAICCPIAPYDQPRKEVRRMVEEKNGTFILVYVSTPLLVCELRDRKGLYAKARAGLIKEFTGISDPYEIPDDAELVIDTAQCTIEQAVEEILDYLRERGLIS